MIIDNTSGLSFKYVLPDGSTVPAEADSNLVSTEVLTYSVPKVKSSDKTFVQEGETARHTVVVTNNSKAKLYNMFFTDTMSEGASYEPASVSVNGVDKPLFDPVAGFNLPDMEPDDETTVSYTVRATNPLTQTSVQNYATLAYSVDDPIKGPVNFSENTNTIGLQVISNRISVVKSVDKAFAVKGDILHYTTKITNTGTL